MIAISISIHDSLFIFGWKNVRRNKNKVSMPSIDIALFPLYRKILNTLIANCQIKIIAWIILKFCMTSFERWYTMVMPTCISNAIYLQTRVLIDLPSYMLYNFKIIFCQLKSEMYFFSIVVTKMSHTRIISKIIFENIFDLIYGYY